VGVLYPRPKLRQFDAGFGRGSHWHDDALPMGGRGAVVTVSEPLVRENPIPAGRYWLDIPDGEKANRLSQWFKINDGYVSENRQHTTHANGRWYLVFDVVLPVMRWPDAWGIGLPTQWSPGSIDPSKRTNPYLDKPVFDFDLSDIGGPLLLFGILWLMGKGR
jgi:hypothetical protein